MSLLIILANFFVNNLVKEEKINEVLRFFRNDLSDYFTLPVNIESYPTEQRVCKLLENNNESYAIFCGEDRRKYIKNPNNHSIVTFGCSYSYGHGLKKEETFQSYLSSLTKYNVFNYAMCGGDIIGGLNDLKNHPEHLTEMNDVEYVIYTYMYDHINRFLSVSSFYNHYEFLFDNSEEKIIKQLLKAPLFRLLLSSFQLYLIKKELPQTDKIEKSYKNAIKRANEQLKLFFPNTKFIVILYNEKLPNDRSAFDIWFVSQFMESEIWEELKQEENIQIVRTKDVVGFYFDKEYKLKEDIADWHPNSKVWKEFTPKFVSQYIK